MANQISLRGFVSSDMEIHTTDKGLIVGQFRMGSNDRQRDSVTNEWVDGKTNWFRVNTFRSLASNTMVSIRKGDRILVVGRLRVTSFLRKDGTPGNGVEIDADSIGPDLVFGITSYKRMVSSRPAGQGNTKHEDGGSETAGQPSDLSNVNGSDTANANANVHEANFYGRDDGASIDTTTSGDDDEFHDHDHDDDADENMAANAMNLVLEESDEDLDGSDGADRVNKATGEITKVLDPF